MITELINVRVPIVGYHSSYGRMLCKMCQNPRSQQWGVRFTFLVGKPAIQTRCMAGTVPHKSGRCRDKSMADNNTKHVWISDICGIQSHGKKHISIRCNRIEHWLYLRCAGIRLAQYTYTWTCYLHNGSRLTTHT